MSALLRLALGLALLCAGCPLFGHDPLRREPPPDGLPSTTPPPTSVFDLPPDPGKPEVDAVVDVGPDVDSGAIVGRDPIMAVDVPKGQAPAWTSSNRMVVAAGRIVVPQPDQRRLNLVLEASFTLEDKLQLEARPVAMLADPLERVWVTEEAPGALVLLDPAEGSELMRLPVGPQARGLARHPTLDIVYAVSPLTDELVAFDAAIGVERERIATVARPAWVATTTYQGKVTAWVVGEGGEVAAHDTLSTGELAEPETLELRAGNSWWVGFEGIATDPVGVFDDPFGDGVLVGHSVAAPSKTVDDVDDGGYGARLPFAWNVPPRPVEPTISRLARTEVVEGVSGKPVTVDTVVAGVQKMALHLLSDPSDIVHHRDKSIAFMAGRGSRSVLAFNTGREDAAADVVAHIVVDDEPSALALGSDGRTLYVSCEGSSTLSKAALGPLLDSSFGGTFPVVKLQGVPMIVDAPALVGSAAAGRRLFHDATDLRMSPGGTSCATCHRAPYGDGLVWQSPAETSNTPSLGDADMAAGPYGWAGGVADLDEYLQQKIARLGGGGLGVAERGDLIAYLTAAPWQVDSPWRPDPDEGPTEAQLAGEALFEDPDVGCAGCHGETPPSRCTTSGPAASSTRRRCGACGRARRTCTTAAPRPSRRPWPTAAPT